ncbi:hypothetical protein [Flectobacillus major]|jgi:hypothetical protein|uniref:hypothetical protein n=1 Tax=Flectobacillus major TaxID=103 RepID=UPI0004087059|nr:hypothetical protein [Flectobacillus major]
MPAKKEYLSSSGQRAVKITAAILGGYLVSASFHLLLSVVTHQQEIVMLTSTISLFLVWIGLMLLSFLARNGWKILGIYLGITFLFSILIYLFK